MSNVTEEEDEMDCLCNSDDEFIIFTGAEAEGAILKVFLYVNGALILLVGPRIKKEHSLAREANNLRLFVDINRLGST